MEWWAGNWQWGVDGTETKLPKSRRSISTSRRGRPNSCCFGRERQGLHLLSQGPSWCSQWVLCSIHFTFCGLVLPCPAVCLGRPLHYSWRSPCPFILITVTGHMGWGLLFERWHQLRAIFLLSKVACGGKCCDESPRAIAQAKVRIIIYTKQMIKSILLWGEKSPKVTVYHHLISEVCP